MSFYTVEEFTEYQQQLSGRQLTEKEKMVVEECIPIFNIAYDKGRNNDVKWAVRTLKLLNDFITENMCIMENIRNWIIYAWLQGHNDGAE